MSIDLGIDGITDAKEIGRGGFGVVYSALESDLGRTVAVKLLQGEFDQQARVRFDRERLAMGSLSGHPNIVTVYRSGFNRAGVPFILMEYLSGGSMAEQAKREGRLPSDQVARLGTEIASALGSAHRSGVLHRDVKPGNILISNTGVSKLGDFGIARMHGSAETQSAVITASIVHAPPEVIMGSRPDEKADIYSLASTLFQMAWGAPAFYRPNEESLVPMLARIAQDEPIDLAPVGVDSRVAAVIAKGMSKNKDDRHDSADDFGQALAAALAAAPPKKLIAETPAPAAWPAPAPSPSPAPKPTPPPNYAPTPQVQPLVGAPAAAAPATGGPSGVYPGQGQTASAGGSGDNNGIKWLIGVLGVALVFALGGLALVINNRASDDPTRTTEVASDSTTTVANETTASVAEATTTTVAEATTSTAPTTTAAPTTTEPPTTVLSNASGAISMELPSDWIAIPGEPGSFVASPNLLGVAAEANVPQVQAYGERNENVGGTVFTPNGALDDFSATEDCPERQRGEFDNGTLNGRFMVIEACETSEMVIYALVTSPPDRSFLTIMLVYAPPEDFDALVAMITASAVWDPAALP